MAVMEVAEVDNTTRYKKSGQRIGEGFISSVVASYTNITYDPLSIFLVLIISTTLFAEAYGHTGPLEIFKKKLTEVKEPPWLKKLCEFLMSITDFLIENKMSFIKISIISIPAMVKPSSKNILISIVVSVLVLIFTNWTIFDIFVLGNFYYLYTELRSPTYKFIIIFLAVIYFYYGWYEVTFKTTETAQNVGDAPTQRSAAGDAPTQKPATGGVKKAH